MKANVGSTDKIIRYTIAVLMVALYATGTLTGTWGYVALGVAAIAVVTSLFSFCGLYAVLGISTCKVEPGR